MSGEGAGPSTGPLDPNQRVPPQATPQATAASTDGEPSPAPVDDNDEDNDEDEAEEEWREGKGRDCVVCQNGAINRVLLPCRHACVCDVCVSRFQHCPICRAFVMESFARSQGPAGTDGLTT